MEIDNRANREFFEKIEHLNDKNLSFVYILQFLCDPTENKNITTKTMETQVVEIRIDN